MGCFSFICKVCDKPIRSTCSEGELVTLFLLKDGKVIEKLEGQYSCYGTVLEDSWMLPWREVVGLMTSHSKGNGIAAIHNLCFIPTTKSEDDPRQGAGKLNPIHLKKWLT